MGLFDTIRWQAQFPDDALGPRPVFQTYSLGRGMNQYTVTAAGQLLYHPVAYSIPDEPEPIQGRRFSPLEITFLPGIDLEYHGDLLLHPCTGRERTVEHAARFTRGMLEWVRQLADLTATHRQWLSGVGSS
jgi:hypothetical protein